jgi:hypothetical protein
MGNSGSKLTLSHQSLMDEQEKTQEERESGGLAASSEGANFIMVNERIFVFKPMVIMTYIFVRLLYLFIYCFSFNLAI